MKKTFAMALLTIMMAVCCAAQTSTGGQESTLRITNGPVVEMVSDIMAQVAWSTNASSGTLLRYGTAPDQLDQKASMPWGAITHRVELKNLKPGTTYYAQAVSDQGQGTGATVESQPVSFQTKPAANLPAANLPAANLKDTQQRGTCSRSRAASN